MIKTLRITTIIAAIIAVILAVGFFAFPAVFGFCGDEEIEQFLKSPGAIEKFNKAKGTKPLKTGSQISPLVKQANAFGLYLNPPPKPKPGITRRGPRTSVVQREQVKKVFSVKFTLIGTSRYPARPELSLAYINEPGKGLHWVRQGSNVAHLIIEEVKDGSVVVKDGEKTVTLVAVRPPRKSLIKGQTTSKSAPAFPGASATITSGGPLQVSAGKSPASPSGKPPTRVASGRPTQVGAKKSPASTLGKPSATIASRRTRQPSPEETAMLEKLIAELGVGVVQAGTDAGKIDLQRSAKRSEALLDKFMSDFQAMRVSAEEAKRLDRLGKELRHVQQDPNRARSLKVERSRTRPQPPPRPPR